MRQKLQLLKASRPKTVTEQLRVVEAERDLLKAKADMYRGDAVRATLALNQTMEQISNDQHVPINPSVQRAAELHTHLANPSIPHPADRFFQTEQQQHSNMKPRNMTADQLPVADLNLSDDEVQRRTGFPTLFALLTYLFIVCDGDVELLQQRNSSLTWFEEWFMHFEYKWGRTLTRLWDVEKLYGPNRHIIGKVTCAKYSIERQAMQRWPVYASTANIIMETSSKEESSLNFHQRLRQRLSCKDGSMENWKAASPSTSLGRE
mmetsp:Transcript_2837/g.5151  ORF Transcript_2837/g.5151 Transcript_2837/m.5151 type:complete len:263 (-) Transcript_2837:324-1112(-)